MTAAWLCACAGPQHPWSDNALCGMDKEWNIHSTEYETWFALLLRGYDAESKRATNPAVDCTGAQVKWEAPVAECNDSPLSRTALASVPLTEKDVVVSPMGENLQLVWVTTNYFASGDALGPAAVVETKPGRLVVRAIGSLRGYPLRAKLRLEKLGETEALVAEGEHCTSVDPESCDRATRVMPLRGTRFVPEPLLSETGTCFAAAWFDLSRHEVGTLDSGWRRRYHLTGAMVFDPQGIRVEEELVINDSDPRQPSTPPRLFRRAEGERTVKFQRGHMITSGHALWGRVVNAKE